MPTDVDDQIITSRGGVELRPEAVSHDGEAHDWGKLCVEFQKYLRKNTGTPAHWNSHAYSKKSANATYGKIRGGGRWLKQNTTDHDHIQITTLLLTIVGWERDESGEPAPAYDYLSDLIGGRSAVINQLDKVLCNYDYGYVWVIEPHGEKNESRLGYPHIHIGVFIQADSVDEVRQTLLENSNYYTANAFARRADHDTQAVSISKPDDPGNSVTLASELTNDLIGHGLEDLALAENLGSIDESDVERHVKLGSLLWAGRKPQVGKNAYFDECIDQSQDPEEYDPDINEKAAFDGNNTDSNSSQTVTSTESVEIEYNYPTGFE